MDEFTKYDTLFRNVWLHGITDGDVREALITVSQETWDKLKENFDQYCPRVKDLIQEQMNYESYGTSKIKVVEMDEKTWINTEHIKRNMNEKKSIDTWNTYKKENMLQRPLSELDNQKENTIKHIQILNKSLSDAQAIQAKKYLPPGQRRAEPPKNKVETELISKIGFLQNELKNIDDRIVKEENDWDYSARREFEHKKFLESNKAYYGMHML